MLIRAIRLPRRLIASKLSSLERFYTTPTTQGGFLRFLTRPWKDEKKAEHPPRMTVADAFETLRGVISSPATLFCRTTSRSRMFRFVP